MKLPRWIVVILILVSVLMPVSLASWLWISWPATTVRDFVTSLSCNRVQEAAEFSIGFQRVLIDTKFAIGAPVPFQDQPHSESWIVSQWNVQPPEISFSPRGIRELVPGRRIARIRWTQALPGEGRETVELEVEVVRGHIRIIGETREGANALGSWKSSGKSTDDSWDTHSVFRRRQPVRAE